MDNLDRKKHWENISQRAKQRLGNSASIIKWIVADASIFEPTEKCDFWLDRAAFHFLTQKQEITNYIDTVQRELAPFWQVVICLQI